MKFLANRFNSFLAYFRNVSIPGIKTLSERDQPIFLKLIWLSVITLCFYLCIYQLSGRIEYYFNYPVTLSYELRSVDRLQFPYITLCEHRPEHEESSPFDFYGDYSDVIETCQYGGKKLCNSSMFWFPNVTAIGYCYTLIIPETFYYFGPSSGIRFTLKSDNTTVTKWRVLISRDWKDAIYDMIDKSIIIYPNFFSTISYIEKLYIHENVSIRPCFPADVVKRCMFAWKDQMVLNNTDCKSPFMYTVDLPICNSSLVHNPGQSLLKKVIPFRCGKSCEVRTYELQMDTRVEMSLNKTVVNVFSLREEVEVLAEKRSFVLYALICEIGGTLGLFLGACLLTIIEIIECIVAGICQKTKETNVKPLKHKKSLLVYTINMPGKRAYATHFSP